MWHFVRRLFQLTIKLEIEKKNSLFLFFCSIIIKCENFQQWTNGIATLVFYFLENILLNFKVIAAQHQLIFINSPNILLLFFNQKFRINCGTFSVLILYTINYEMYTDTVNLLVKRNKYIYYGVEYTLHGIVCIL